MIWSRFWFMACNLDNHLLIYIPRKINYFKGSRIFNLGFGIADFGFKVVSISDFRLQISDLRNSIQLIFNENN